MSWTLSASGRLDAGAEHLEQELHDALHGVLSDPRFGLLASHFQGATVDRLHTAAHAVAAASAGAVPQAPEPETAPAAGKVAKATAKGR